MTMTMPMMRLTNVTKTIQSHGQRARRGGGDGDYTTLCLCSVCAGAGAGGVPTRTVMNDSLKYHPLTA